MRNGKKNRYRLSLDRCFATVMDCCAQPRKIAAAGVWLHQRVKQAYLKLHQLGYAHSLEIWVDQLLVGGLYGLALGRCFCGESMFYRRPYATRLGFLTLARYLFDFQKFCFIDCQQESEHMLAVGALSIPRQLFCSHLREALNFSDHIGPWHELFQDFPDSTGWLFDQSL